MSIKDFHIAIFTVLLLASNVIVLKEAFSYCSLDVFNFFRFAVFLLFIPFIKLEKGKFKHILFFGFFNCVLNFLFISKAISTDIPTAYIGLLSVPRIIFVILLAYLILKERFNFYQFFGMTLSCLALVLFKIDSSSVEKISMFYLFLSALSWAIATTYIKKNKIHFTLSDLCYSNAISAPMMLVYIGITDQINFLPVIEQLDVNFIFMVLYGALIPILFATKIWNNLLLKYDAIQLNPIMNLFSFMVFFESIIFLNESFNPIFMTLLTILFFSLMMCQNYKPWKNIQKATIS